MLGPEHRSALSQLDWWVQRLGPRPSFVYVVQGGESGPIKVGVAVDVLARIATLQTGNWVELRLLHVVPGAYELEAEFHRRLADQRVRGEWFDGPDVEGFLVWVANFAKRAIVEYRSTGTLPKAAPAPRKFKRVGLRSGAWNRKGSTWRTSNSTEEAPVTIRYVKPDPRRPEPVELPDPDEFPELYLMLKTGRRFPL